MKKRSLLLSVLLSIISALFPRALYAQEIGQEYAIFNWQNNEDFNAFLNIDIDSITYSNIDLNGRTHHNVVVQEVWTPDSVYRIPITAIDSIAFRAPDPILKEGIFHIREFHYPFVIKVTDLTVTFDASIPTDSLPVVGQVVITDIYEGLLEKGFAGRVINIVRTGSTALIECEEVTLDDVYDLLVCVGKSVSYIDEESPAGVPKRLHYEKEGVLSYEIAKWNTKIIDEEEDDDNVHGNLELTITPSIKLDYAVCYKVKNKENRFKCVVSPILDCDFDSNWKVSGSVSFPKNPKDFISVKIPTKVPGLVAKIGVKSFLELSGSAELDIKVPLRIQANVGYDSQRKKYNENAFFANFDGTGIRSTDGVSDGNSQVKLEGSIYTGLMLDFTVFFLHEKVANARIGLKAGPKFTANIDFSNNLTYVPSWYDFKDTKVTVEPLVAQVTASVNTLFTEESPWSSQQSSIFGQKDYYLFPVFTAPVLPSLDTNEYSLTALTTDISRDLIFKVTPGIGLYENNQLKYSYFSDKKYQRQADWDKKNLQMELHEQYPSGTYTTKPIFKFFNSTIVADSIDTVTIPEVLSVLDFFMVKKNETSSIPFSGGWGKYTLTNSNPAICSASLNEPLITITGKKNGNATLTLIDQRSGDEKTVNVLVYDHSFITVSQTSLNFGDLYVGQSREETFTVTGTNLTTDLTLTRSGSSYFSFSPTTITPVNGNVNETVKVTYNPTTTGNHSGYITVCGSGINSKTVDLLGTCPQPIISVDQTSLDFGNVLVGQSKQMTFTVTGTNMVGDISLALQNTGMNADFTISPEVLPASGGSVSVTCNVSSEGDINGKIILSSAGAGEVKIDLSGVAVKPSITVYPTSLDFGNVFVGQSKKMTFTVQGTNTVDNISLALPSSSTNANFTISPETLPTSGGTVTVTCFATNAGEINETLLVSSNGTDDKIVVLSGTAVLGPPSILVTPTSLDFGTLRRGEVKSMTFSVKGRNLTDSLSISCDNPEFLVLSNQVITPEQAASGVTVLVLFNANILGINSGAITISGSGASSKTVSLTAICEGNGDDSW